MNNSILQEGVAGKLRENPGNTKGPKGEDGRPGKDGESPPADAVAAQLMNDDNRNTLVTEVAKNEDLQKSVAGNQDLRDAVAINLKKDETFQTTVKGDSGKDGKSPPVDAIAAQLLTGANRNTLAAEVASNKGFTRSYSK